MPAHSTHTPSGVRAGFSSIELVNMRSCKKIEMPKLPLELLPDNTDLMRLISAAVSVVARALTPADCCRRKSAYVMRLTVFCLPPLCVDFWSVMSSEPSPLSSTSIAFITPSQSRS